MKEEFTLGAAQIQPEYHDREGSLNRAYKYIEKAGGENVDLLAFPETYVPGYPYWRGTSISRWTELMVELQKNAISVDGGVIGELEEKVRENDLNLALGCNELSDLPGSETLYNTILFFSRDGKLLGRHRKLMPTHEERAIWGRGDPSDIRTFGLDIGATGGLICYENHMTLLKAAMASLGEEIHVSVWPGFWEQNLHPGDKSRASDKSSIHTCDQYAAMREYAFETQTFVVSASMYIDVDEIREDLRDEMRFNIAAGGSMIINPAGIVKKGPLLNEEGLLTAKVDADERRATKTYFDSMGHYSRWDAVSLDVEDFNLTPYGREKTGGWVEKGKVDLESLADKYELDPDLLREIIEEIRNDGSY